LFAIGQYEQYSIPAARKPRISLKIMKAFYPLLVLAASVTAQSSTLQGELEICSQNLAKKINPATMTAKCPGAMELLSTRSDPTMLVKRLNDYCTSPCRSFIQDTIKAADCTPRARSIQRLTYETNFDLNCLAMDGRYCASHFLALDKDFQIRGGPAEDPTTNPKRCHPCLSKQTEINLKMQKTYGELVGQPRDQVEKAAKDTLDRLAKTCSLSIPLVFSKITSQTPAQQRPRT
jgi:hypothetical protein